MDFSLAMMRFILRAHQINIAHTYNSRNTQKSTNHWPVWKNKCVENGLNHLPFACITHIKIFFFFFFFIEWEKGEEKEIVVFICLLFKRMSAYLSKKKQDKKKTWFVYRLSRAIHIYHTFMLPVCLHIVHVRYWILHIDMVRNSQQQFSRPSLKKRDV